MHAKKRRGGRSAWGKSLVPFASFSVLVSNLFHVHWLGAGLVSEACFSSLLGLCLCAIGGTLVVLCPQPLLLLRPKHRTVAIVRQYSLLFSLLRLKQVTISGSVEVG